MGPGPSPSRTGARVIDSPPKRGTQLDRGAREAKGDLLLFLHADTRLEPGWKEALERLPPEVVGGAFHFALHTQRPGSTLRRVGRDLARSIPEASVWRPGHLLPPRCVPSERRIPPRAALRGCGILREAASPGADGLRPHQSCEQRTPLGARRADLHHGAEQLPAAALSGWRATEPAVGDVRPGPTLRAPSAFAAGLLASLRGYWPLLLWRRRLGVGVGKRPSAARFLVGPRAASESASLTCRLAPTPLRQLPLWRQPLPVAFAFGRVLVAGDGGGIGQQAGAGPPGGC